MAATLEVQNIAKQFGGIPVLIDVSLSAEPGKVCVLGGENGAGKSTLLKIISGQYKQDHGHVLVGDKELTRADPRAARRLGIGIVPQELAPYPELTVYENIFVGREIRNAAGILNRRAMIKQARQMLEVFDVDIDPRTPVRKLGVALTQILEIAKATTWGAQILLFDEPTSAIPEREVDRLHSVIHKLKEQNVAMIYTTHRMEEIEKLADHVVVLRDGNLVLDEPVQNTSPDSIVRATIGRELGTLFPKLNAPHSKVGLTVKELKLKADGPAVDLQVRNGEILGLGGLVGAGRTEILEAIFGIRSSVAGEIKLHDKPYKRHSPRGSIKAGIGIVPEDRKGSGLILCRSVLDNGSLPHLSTWTYFGGWLRNRSRRKDVNEATEAVSLRSRGADQLAMTLSGGNQQKVVLARWLTRGTKVLLLDEPTRGVDIGARGEIYNIITDLASQGLAIIMASSDMPELIGLSHRVLVMRGGEIQGELDRTDLESEDVQEKIFRLASGHPDLDESPDKTLEKPLHQNN